MLKDFVSVSSNIIHIHNNVARLHLVFRNYELLQNEMMTNIERFKTSTETLLDGFQQKYHEDIITTMFPTHADADLFFQSKNALMRPLANTKTEYSGYFEKYKHYIQSKIIGSYKNAIILLQTWLSKDLDNLPYTLISDALNVLMISIDNEDESLYSTSRTTTIRVLSQRDIANSAAVFPSCVSYSFLIDCSAIEFWSHRRKVSESREYIICSYQLVSRLLCLKNLRGRLGLFLEIVVVAVVRMRITGPVPKENLNTFRATIITSSRQS